VSSYSPAVLATLTARHVRVERGSDLVLRDVSLTIGPRSRIGIVGPNGVGKSTFLSVLAGSRGADSGSVELAPPEATVGLLAQERESHPNGSVRDELERRVGAVAAETELQAAAEALAGADPNATERYAVALERWAGLGLDTLDARIDSVLAELGLPTSLLGVPVDGLSGGQAARVALAAILLSRFDITLLDEPTNDLDFDGLERLEAFVNGRAGGLVVVSHDRAFLERTVSAVLELDEHDRTGTYFAGSWSAYLDERATARRHAEESFAVYDAKRDALAERARREREWATSAVSRERRKPRDNDRAQRDFRINRTERLAARARSTERAIERLEHVDRPWKGWKLQFEIEHAPRAGTVIARLDGAYVERGEFALGPIDLEIDWGERVALVGPNGSGKTTLIDALLGRAPLSRGTRSIGPSVVVGEIGQRRDAFSADGSLLDGFIARTGLPTSEARTLLAKFGLGAAHVLRSAPTLSPGERTRAELAVFQARGVNFLVLDEPTNHLDLPAIEQLEQALDEFDGTLLVVSHDRRLLERLEFTREIQPQGFRRS
jgi:ATPase subunit of ABC transporter with duplicated ATPase domains